MQYGEDVFRFQPTENAGQSKLEAPVPVDLVLFRRVFIYLFKKNRFKGDDAATDV